jgi:phage baseplate assembly protein V
MSYDQSDQQRQISNLLRVGVISAIDFSTRKIRVTSGDTTTGWLDWPAEIGRNYVRWRPLRLDTQVLLASPNGELRQAQVVNMLYTSALSPPTTDEQIDRIAFNDGTLLEYDSSTRTLQVQCTGTLKLQAQSLTLEASSISIMGPVTQTGGDLTSDGKSVQKHQHRDSLGGNTSAPQ